MRGEREQQSTMLSLVSTEQRVPKDHPLRRIKQIADAALKELSPTFDAMYAKGGRKSLPPEALLKATLLMALYSVPSERSFCEQLDYNLLWRWFLDMGVVDESFDHSTFSANRERLLEADSAAQFLGAVVTDRGMGLGEELPQEGRAEAPAAGRLEESGRRLSRREARQRDARVDDRSGSAACAQGLGPAREALLRAARADGEQERTHRRRARDQGDGHGRAGRGAPETSRPTWRWCRIGSRRSTGPRRDTPATR
jgi:transposase